MILAIMRATTLKWLRERSERDSGLGPVSRKSRELFGSENPAVKLQTACFEKVISWHVFNVRNTKRIANCRFCTHLNSSLEMGCLFEALNSQRRDE